jgi:formylglycine-generating enzyme required for sulfatase activity
MQNIDDILRTAMMTGFIIMAVHLSTAQEARPDMVFVQGGKFKMGSVLGGADEQPVHEVTVARLSVSAGSMIIPASVSLTGKVQTQPSGTGT